MASKEPKETGTDLVKPGETGASQNASLEDQILLLLAALMEGGQEDDETCRNLDNLTRFLSDESPKKNKAKAAYEYVDTDVFETIMGYLDMRQPEVVRGHATLTVSAYLKASDVHGVDYLTRFFRDRVKKGTYDDYIVAFSVAASIFPLVPATCAELFLNPGFINSLGPLMKRKWKSKKVEQACLEMINAACMNTACRSAIQRQCSEWLEEIITTEPHQFGQVDSSSTLYAVLEHGPEQHRIHSDNVVNLAAVILAKLQAVPPTATTPSGERIKPFSTSIEVLTERFFKMMESGEESARERAIEGLAYTSMNPQVRETVVDRPGVLEFFKEYLQVAEARREYTYGILTILTNVTVFQPTLTEEQKKMIELASYASAQGGAHQPDPLNDDEHVLRRCQKIFDAGFVPLLVTHCGNGTGASHTLVASIILSIARIKEVRPQLVQQGAVKVLLKIFDTFPDTDFTGHRITAHALARILISVDPNVVFGGSDGIPKEAAVRPLLTLLSDDPTTETIDRLPTFEGLLALTNLASTDDKARDAITNGGWDRIDELMFVSNTLLARALIQLINNLAVGPACAAKYAASTPKAYSYIYILLAFLESEDEPTALAAGGALAELTQYEAVVTGILGRDRGVVRLVNLCKSDSVTFLHRGATCVYHIVHQAEEIAKFGIKAVRDADGINALLHCIMYGQLPEIVELALQSLKAIATEEEINAAGTAIKAAHEARNAETD